MFSKQLSTLHLLMELIFAKLSLSLMGGKFAE